MLDKLFADVNVVHLALCDSFRGYDLLQLLCHCFRGEINFDGLVLALEFDVVIDLSLVGFWGFGAICSLFGSIGLLGSI